MLQQNKLQTFLAGVSCPAAEPLPAVLRPRPCRAEHRSRQVRWRVIDAAHPNTVPDVSATTKPSLHPQEVDSLYLFACHLEWETHQEPPRDGNLSGQRRVPTMKHGLTLARCFRVHGTCPG